MTHGLLASALTPIEVGPFAEDEEAFWKRVFLVVESLQPRNPLEERLAREVASGFIRMDRLDGFEVAAYESAARINADLRRRLDAVEEFDELAALARGLHFHLIGASELESAPWREWATLMRTMGPRPGIPIRGLWDDDHQPSSEDEWSSAFRLLLKHLWGDREAAAVWARRTWERLTDEWEARVGREREIVGDRALDGPLEKATRYHSRILNDLVKSVELLRTVRSMHPEGCAGSNEPTGE